MNRKPLSLRQFVLVGVAVVAGTSAGSAADAIISGADAGPVVGGLAALWVVDKLNKLIDDRNG